MAQRDPFQLVGTTVGEKYVVESVVDEGGFSVVYRAMHVIWRRPVAIKVFKLASELNEDGRQSLLRAFIQEGALLTELSERSPAICQARDVGTFTTARGEWVPYLVLEWLEGECLEVSLMRERKEKTPPRSLAKAMRLLAPVVEALAVAHGRGIAHCDVKPGNIFLLSDQGCPCPTKLVDFGVARVPRDARASAPADSGSFTPAYGAPEQFLSTWGKTGPWTDVFALALIFVELLSGEEPLRSGNVYTLAAQVVDPRGRPTPRARGVVVSDAVEEVFARALAVDPQARYGDAGEFWSALRAAVYPRGLSAGGFAHRKFLPAVTLLLAMAGVALHASGFARPRSGDALPMPAAVRPNTVCPNGMTHVPGAAFCIDAAASAEWEACPESSSQNGPFRPTEYACAQKYCATKGGRVPTEAETELASHEGVIRPWTTEWVTGAGNAPRALPLEGVTARAEQSSSVRIRCAKSL